MTLMSLRAALGAVVLAGCAAALTGCGVNPETAVSSAPETGALTPIKGSAYGGQQPLYGSKVYMFATGSGGVGTAATSLKITSDPAGVNYTSDSVGYYVLTGSKGASDAGTFDIVNSPTCTVGSQAYLYIVGGDPGFGANAVAGLLAPVGSCASGTPELPSGVTFVQANEITTVVTAYALGGFATSPTSIASGKGANALAGIANAMNTAFNIVNISTGYTSATTANGLATVPMDKINLIANALADCINSSGPVGASNPSCTSLYTDTGAASGSDTAAVAIALAHAPFLTSAKSTDLYNLANSPVGSVFPVNLSSAPVDYTLGLQYQTAQYTANKTASASAFVDNYSAAFDSAGNLWTRGTNDKADNSLTTFAEYDPTGKLLNSASVTGAANTLNAYSQLAIDSGNNVWSGVGNMEYVVTGSTAKALATSSSCLPSTNLTSTVFGADGAAYVGEYRTNKLWKYSSAGCTSSLTAPSGNSFTGFTSVEPDGTVLSTGFNGGNNYVFKLSSGSFTSFPAGGDFITSDNSGYIWGYSVSTTGTRQNDSVNRYSESGTSTSQTIYLGGLSQTAYPDSYRAGNQGVQIDGAGVMWVPVSPCTASSCANDIIVGVANSGTTGITPPFTSAGNTTSGGGLALPNNETGAHAVAPDASGNLWTVLADGSLIQFVGLTTPVATPVLYTQLGTTPK